MHSDQIILEHLSKKYTQPDREIVVLDDISAVFEQNQTYAIMGPSGSGKSTLLHIIAGFDTPTNGRVLINNIDSARYPLHKRTVLLRNYLGVVFQQPHLIQELTVAENIKIKDLIMGVKMSDLHWHDTLVNALGIADLLHRYPHELSGGQQQRISLARALYNRPKYILADEPTASLDESTAQQLTQLLVMCAMQWHMGVIIVTHDPVVARNMNHMYQLHDGHLQKI